MLLIFYGAAAKFQKNWWGKDPTLRAPSLFGFVWVYFHRACKVIYFHNALLKQ